MERHKQEYNAMLGYNTNGSNNVSKINVEY